MKLTLCPRCELNYITENERFCKVCMQEMHGLPSEDEVEMCSICNESPALPGRDVCALCLKEMGNAPDEEEGDGDSEVPSESIGNMDSVTQMDEIIPEMEQDIPREEYGEIDHELSLESVREDEEKQQDEEDQEPEAI